MESLIPSSDDKRAFSTPSVKKPDGSDGLDAELTFSKTFQKIGAGLENLDKNACFINSVLQCLKYIEPLAAYLQKVAHEKCCYVAGFCALCAMQKHVRTARQATAEYYQQHILSQTCDAYHETSEILGRKMHMSKT